jgi:hypothetical protein
MMSGKLLGIFLTTAAVLLLTAAVAVCQQVEANGNTIERSKNNTLGLNLSTRAYLDGSPLWQPKYPGVLLRWMNLGLGVQYSRELGKRHGFGLSLMGNTIHYFSTRLGYGDTFERAVMSADLFYQFRFASSRNCGFFATVGPNFRYGFESVYLYTFGIEPITYDYDLKDFGITFGTRASRTIVKKLLFSPELRFTTYLYRYAPHQFRYPTEFLNRPTRSMLTLQVGLGYQF